MLIKVQTHNRWVADKLDRVTATIHGISFKVECEAVMPEVCEVDEKELESVISDIRKKALRSMFRESTASEVFTNVMLTPKL
jgi:hypothetical protein